MVKCAVPGCDEMHRANGSKRFSFTFPQKEELLQEWLKALPTIKKPVKKSWRVCQYHFQDDDILDAFSHTIGGEVFVIERERKRLKPNSVPTKNLPSGNGNVPITNTAVTKSENRLVKKSKDMPSKNIAAPIKNMKRTRQEENEGEEWKRQNVVQIQKKNQQRERRFDKKVFSIHSNIPNEKAQISVSLYDGNISTSNRVEIQMDNGKEITTINATAADDDTFENLFDNVFEVVLPTTLWGVHRSPNQKRIMFVCIDEDQLNINKMLTVDNTGVVKTYLTTHLVREESFSPDRTLTIEHLSDMLAELDYKQIHT